MRGVVAISCGVALTILLFAPVAWGDRDTFPGTVREGGTVKLEARFSKIPDSGGRKRIRVLSMSVDRVPMACIPPSINGISTGWSFEPPLRASRRHFSFEESPPGSGRSVELAGTFNKRARKVSGTIRIRLVSATTGCDTGVLHWTARRFS